MDNKVKQVNDSAYLNFFKLFAAFSVFLQHIGQIATRETELINSSTFLSFCKAALCPVMFFFLVSGFLFKRVYYDRFKNGQITSKQFFIGRVKKIYPLMIITTVFFFVLSYISQYCYGLTLPRGSLKFIDLLLGCFIGGNSIFTGQWSQLNGVLWYISVLLIFYALSVLLVKKFSNRIVYLIPIALGFCMYFYGKDVPIFNKMVALGLINYFMGYYVNDLLIYLKKDKKRNIIASISSSVIVGLFLFFFFYFYMNKKVYTLLDYSSCGIVNVLFWIPLMVIFQNLDFFNKFCELKPVKFAFNLNYEFYMWHLFVLSIFWMVIVYNKLYTIDRVGLFFAAFGASIGFAILSNVLITRPLNILLNKKRNQPAS